MSKGFRAKATNQFLSETQTETTEREPEQTAEAPEGFRIVPEARTARMQILLSPTLKARLKECADREHISSNELINKAISEYIERGEVNG